MNKSVEKNIKLILKNSSGGLYYALKQETPKLRLLDSREDYENIYFTQMSFSYDRNNGEILFFSNQTAVRTIVERENPNVEISHSQMNIAIDSNDYKKFQKLTIISIEAYDRDSVKNLRETIYEHNRLHGFELPAKEKKENILNKILSIFKK